jgi:DNA polymerase III beta subunit
LKFIVNQEEFKQAVLTVEKAIELWPLISGVSDITIETLENEIRLSGVNSNFKIEVKLLSIVLEQGKISVRGKIFNSIIRTLKDKEIKIYTSKSGGINLECGSFNCVIPPSEEEINSKAYMIKKPLRFNVHAKKLKNMAMGSVFSSTCEGYLRKYRGVLINVVKNNMILTGTDQVRTSILRTKVDLGSEVKVLVDGATLQEIIKVISRGDNNKDVQVTVSDNFIVFEIDNIRVYSRELYTDEYPDLEGTFKNDYISTLIGNRIEFLYCVERVNSIFYDEKESSLTLECNEQSLFVSARHNSITCIDKVNILLDGDTFKMQVNGKYLLEALKVLDAEQVKLLILKEKNSFILTNKENYDYWYYIPGHY